MGAVHCMGSGVEWSVLVELIPFGVFFGRQFLSLSGMRAWGDLLCVYWWAWEWRRITLHRAGLVYYSGSI